MNGRPERSTRSLWLRGGRRCRPCHQQVPASQSIARLPPPVDLLEAVLTLHRQSKPPLSSTAAASSTYLYKYRPVCLIERGVHQSYHCSFAKTTNKTQQKNSLAASKQWLLATSPFRFESSSSCNLILPWKYSNVLCDLYCEESSVASNKRTCRWIKIGLTLVLPVCQGLKAGQALACTVFCRS